MTLTAEPTKHLPEDACKSEKEEHIKKIIEANQITMRIARCIPRETMVEQGGHRHPTWVVKSQDNNPGPSASRKM